MGKTPRCVLIFVRPGRLNAENVLHSWDIKIVLQNARNRHHELFAGFLCVEFFSYVVNCVFTSFYVKNIGIIRLYT